MDVEFKFTERKFSLTGILAKLRTFVMDSVRDAIRNRAVYPNKITATFPFTQPDSNFTIEQIGTEPTALGSTSKIDAFRESASRFIDEILQLNKVDVIPKVFEKDCCIEGFLPSGRVFEGHNGVEAFVYYLQNALDTVCIDVTELQMAEERLFLHWSCTGNLIGSFWNRSDSNHSTITLKGAMTMTCKYSELNFATLQSVTFSWDARTMTEVLALPPTNEDNAVNIRTNRGIKL